MKKLIPALALLSLASAPAADEVTYARHISRLLQDRCADCHREGGGAPFALRDYESARRKTNTILRVLESGYMPPWHAIGGDIPLEGDRRLTPEEIALFKQWAEAGCPEGDPADLPEPRQFPDGWTLGEPDLVLTMEQAYELPAEGPDIYRNFVIPSGLTSEKFVKAVEFRPSSPSVVHHALFAVDTKGRARQRDAADPVPGFTDMPVGEGTGSRFGGWVPGARPQPLPEGLAIRLPAGSDIVLQMHFHLTGKPEVERSQIAFYFGDKEPGRLFTTLQLPPFFGAFTGIDLAPGATEYTVTDSFELPVAVRAFGAHAHSHYRGKSLNMTARLPDGRSIKLLNIPEWDMNWQEYYRFAGEVALPAGTRLESTVVWDNSAESAANPVVPPVRVRWGLESFDEMGSIDLFVIMEGKPKEAERALKTLRAAERDHVVWQAGSHVLEPQKLDVFGELRRKAIQRFDQNGNGVLEKAERELARASLEQPAP